MGILKLLLTESLFKKFEYRRNIYQIGQELQ